MGRIIPIKTDFSSILQRSDSLNFRIPIGTLWEFEHFRQGKLIDQWKQGNVTTDEGLNAFLDIMFHGSTQIATWYMTVFELDYTPLVTNTYAVPGYTECIAYTLATRPEFVEAAASGKVLTNTANKASFTFNATKTIYGASLVGGGTDPTVKANTAGGGTLFASSKFGTSKNVVNTDVLLVTCTITLADV
ncbi:MAG: hypothetical protein Q7J15_04150 [Candidatus Desulfaltia sp.]|nr:hypothetical protein [Candidatus Desulfaltia sp.]